MEDNALRTAPVPVEGRSVGLPGILADWQFHARLALPDKDPARLRIEPWVGATKVKGRASWGQGSYGYDLRLGNSFKVFDSIGGMLIDMRAFDESCLRTVKGDSCVIPPNSYALGETMEWVWMPDDCQGIVLGKSTNARGGAILNMTPIEAGWRGKITLEISNATPLFMRLHAGDGIGQLLLFQGSAPCAVPYHKKPGSSYQDQAGVCGPRV